MVKRTMCGATAVSSKRRCLSMFDSSSNMSNFREFRALPSVVRLQALDDCQCFSGDAFEPPALGAELRTLGRDRKHRVLRFPFGKWAPEIQKSELVRDMVEGRAHAVDALPDSDAECRTWPLYVPDPRHRPPFVVRLSEVSQTWPLVKRFRSVTTALRCASARFSFKATPSSDGWSKGYPLPMAQDKREPTPENQ